MQKYCVFATIDIIPLTLKISNTKLLCLKLLVQKYKVQNTKYIKEFINHYLKQSEKVAQKQKHQEHSFDSESFNIDYDHLS